MVSLSTTAAPMNLQSLLDSLPNLAPSDRLLIERAYRKAEVAHAGQTRKSGEPYFTHCVAVASILAEMKLDAEAIAAALMAFGFRPRVGRCGHSRSSRSSPRFSRMKRHFRPAASPSIMLSSCATSVISGTESLICSPIDRWFRR